MILALVLLACQLGWLVADVLALEPSPQPST